ncbi:MAG TPA: NusG domain II-containing protein [Syntrophomonadaceae bacterium]|jgi:hypothetical protein|nr:NusG domain II-containing protein [Syntrophomonadaceae bacterium]HRX21230.1 NusG domain II-containing protein [Syntrophomonadaceae bacterium]
MKRSDLLLVGILIFIGLAGLLVFKSLAADHLIAVIRQDDQVIERIDLTKVKESRTITVSGDYHNIIQIEPNRIRFEKSDCPEQICVYTGWLSEYGDIAVCLPNKAIVSIEKE